ncbi:hypothetical protein OTSANNIE_0446 [Anaplasma phagocytophilum str. Annie]|nr:hypothetical protein APHNYW_0201 [Anaplasma phagocytophilum str. ApNYW]KJV99410.1 hypothetical protein OTSANNIE_0446 [Anaplasma phagocytophilum str. Annie]
MSMVCPGQVDSGIHAAIFSTIVSKQQQSLLSVGSFLCLCCMRYG